MNSDTLALAIIILLTLNLLVVGFYVVMVLKEIRMTLERVNKILTSAEDFADSVRHPVINASTFFSGVTKGMEMIHKFKSDKSHSDMDDEEDEDEDEE